MRCFVGSAETWPGLACDIESGVACDEGEEEFETRHSEALIEEFAVCCKARPPSHLFLASFLPRVASPAGMVSRSESLSKWRLQKAGCGYQSRPVLAVR